MPSSDPHLPVPAEDPGPDVGFAQANAAVMYGRDYRKTLALDDSFKRLDAQDRLAAARRALSAQQVAVMDMAAGRGHALPEIVARTGRPLAFIEGLFLGACARLAEHYERADVAQDRDRLT
ncbi:hypothetical protein [Caulobacter sp. LARHSG274]